MAFRRRKTEISPPYVSMADIAFNLVLFFVILAKTQDKDNLKWEPAESSYIKEIGNSQVSVTVDNENKVYLNGKQVGINELTANVAKQLDENPTEKRLVLLKIHKETLAATFEPILEAISQTGAEVAYVLEEKKRQSDDAAPK